MSESEEEFDIICIACNGKLGNGTTGNDRLQVLSYWAKCNLCNESLCNLAFKRNKGNRFQKSFHSCPKCDKRFASKQTLRNHSYEHNDEWPYRCSKCYKGIALRGHLRRHMISHSDDRNFQCTYCPSKLKSKHGLRKHTALYHTGGGEWKCSTCSKRFFNKAALEVHKRSHSEYKEFECSLCDSRFKHKTSLGVHIRMLHTRDSLQRCKICKKEFSCKSKLRTHMGFHDVRKKYKCKYCTYGFNSEQALTNHMWNFCKESNLDNQSNPIIESRQLG
ncbi:hypothetical protein NPIL_418201 [Nephila pilipes]|uniref:C2H2-type domain-containing protein n=1 Tax=Nephila pilipes TaxID=299642 RepID=A0A8X6NNK9_NEPPI|nr:hypothetical protein NPIL_418201 [Nephila pilipes]